jgi:hypothetical protein
MTYVILLEVNRKFLQSFPVLLPLLQTMTEQLTCR